MTVPPVPVSRTVQPAPTCRDQSGTAQKTTNADPAVCSFGTLRETHKDVPTVQVVPVIRAYYTSARYRCMQFSLFLGLEPFNLHTKIIEIPHKKPPMLFLGHGYSQPIRMWICLPVLLSYICVFLPSPRWFAVLNSYTSPPVIAACSSACSRVLNVSMTTDSSPAYRAEIHVRISMVEQAGTW